MGAAQIVPVRINQNRGARECQKGCDRLQKSEMPGEGGGSAKRTKAIPTSQQDSGSSRFCCCTRLARAHTHTMQETKRKVPAALLRTALAAFSVQLLLSTVVPTANATEYGARRTLYFQDADCRLETFREFAYDSVSLEMDGSASQGAKVVCYSSYVCSHPAFACFSAALRKRFFSSCWGRNDFGR